MAVRCISSKLIAFVTIALLQFINVSAQCTVTPSEVFITDDDKFQLDCSTTAGFAQSWKHAQVSGTEQMIFQRGDPNVPGPVRPGGGDPNVPGPVRPGGGDPNVTGPLGPGQFPPDMDSEHLEDTLPIYQFPVSENAITLILNHPVIPEWTGTYYCTCVRTTDGSTSTAKATVAIIGVLQFFWPILNNDYTLCFTPMWGLAENVILKLSIEDPDGNNLKSAPDTPFQDKFAVDVHHRIPMDPTKKHFCSLSVLNHGSVIYSTRVESIFLPAGGPSGMALRAKGGGGSVTAAPDLHLIAALALCLSVVIAGA